MTLAVSLINFAELNWLAVLVAGFAAFMLGGLWYTALFGKLWQRLNGYSDEKLKEMQAKRPPPVFFGTMIACYMVLALVVGVLVVKFNIIGALDGGLFGVGLWLIVAAVGVTGQIASDKPMKALTIDASYQLLYLVMMGAILGAWR